MFSASGGYRIPSRASKAKQTDSRASDMCAGASAALAINYLNFKDTDPEYAEKCLKGAQDLYDMAVASHEEDPEDAANVLTLGYDGGFYDSSYDYDELSWAAVWLLFLARLISPSRNRKPMKSTSTRSFMSMRLSTYDNGGHPYTGY